MLQDSLLIENMIGNLYLIHVFSLANRFDKGLPCICFHFYGRHFECLQVKTETIINVCFLQYLESLFYQNQFHHRHNYISLSSITVKYKKSMEPKIHKNAYRTFIMDFCTSLKAFEVCKARSSYR